jgi:hypothetical protein
VSEGGEGGGGGGRDSPMREWLPPWVGWRVTRTHKLDPLQLDPGLVRGAVETTVLHNLAQEGNNTLGACTGKDTHQVKVIHVINSFDTSQYI